MSQCLIEGMKAAGTLGAYMISLDGYKPCHSVRPKTMHFVII